MNNNIPALLTRESVFDFLKSLYRDDNAIIEVSFEGSGFVRFLGQELPAEGSVYGIFIEFPESLDVGELRPVLKERIQEDE